MRIKLNQSFRGYTLIELVVVAGILGIIGVVSVGLFLSTIQGGGKSTALNDVRSNGDYAITQMERMIRGARQIISVCEADMDTLEIKNPDGGRTTFTSLNSRIASNSGYLTSDDILLSTGGELTFDCISSSSKSPEIVSIEFTLQKGDPASPNRDFAQADFSTTVQIRSY